MLREWSSQEWWERGDGDYVDVKRCRCRKGSSGIMAPLTPKMSLHLATIIWLPIVVMIAAVPTQVMLSTAPRLSAM
jgi:hypothetical protein